MNYNLSLSNIIMDNCYKEKIMVSCIIGYFSKDLYSYQHQHTFMRKVSGDWQKLATGIKKSK